MVAQRSAAQRNTARTPRRRLAAQHQGVGPLADAVGHIADLPQVGWQEWRGRRAALLSCACSSSRGSPAAAAPAAAAARPLRLQPAPHLCACGRGRSVHALEQVAGDDDWLALLAAPHHNLLLRQGQSGGVGVSGGVSRAECGWGSSQRVRCSDRGLAGQHPRRALAARAWSDAHPQSAPVRQVAARDHDAVGRRHNLSQVRQRVHALDLAEGAAGPGVGGSRGSEGRLARRNPHAAARTRYTTSNISRPIPWQ